MSRGVAIVLVAILTASILVSGCNSIRQSSSSHEGQPDPIIGTWVSLRPEAVTYYRFRENGTFDAWSHTGNVHPKYSFQYSGKWESRESYSYVTEGPHIGYGDVTALAIWRDLTLVYDPASDTFSITVYPDQVFTRLSHDPGFTVELTQSIRVMGYPGNSSP